MVNKELLMNAFKLKILSMMSTENRVAIGVNNENQNLWNKAVLPEELKKVIDNVYKKLNEIAQENNISTESINQMIEGKRGEANIEAQSLYKKKTIEQMNKIQIELAKIKYTVDNGTIKLQEQKENIEEKTSDENNNTVIGEKLYKNIIMSIQNI